jgi:vitamin-K-epoxide reductase (warfarin-sensitive)
MTSKSGQMFLAIAILSVVGIAVSSVSLHNHYHKSESSFCDFGGSFNCDIVNRSVYSTVFGVPVALIGILGYATLLGLATIHRSNRETPKVLLAASLAGLGFALYLTYIEGFVLAAWCALCLASLSVISSIAVLSGVLMVFRNQD